MTADPRSRAQRRRDAEHRLTTTKPQERGDRLLARTGFDPRALATPYRVLLEAGQIEPGDADGDREGGPA